MKYFFKRMPKTRIAMHPSLSRTILIGICHSSIINKTSFILALSLLEPCICYMATPPVNSAQHVISNVGYIRNDIRDLNFRYSFWLHIPLSHEVIPSIADVLLWTSTLSTPILPNLVLFTFPCFACPLNSVSRGEDVVLNSVSLYPSSINHSALLRLTPDKYLSGTEGPSDWAQTT